MADAMFKVRRALPSDKEDVLSIAENLYDGTDYLFACYDDWTEESSGVACYVYEQQGLIIGFVASFIIDDGETAIDCAGRVRPKYAGSGVYKRLLAEVEKLNRRQGRVHKHVQTTSKQFPESFMQKHALITSKEIHESNFSIERYEKTATNANLDCLQQVSDVDLVTFLGDPFATYLFPAARAIVDWCPFRLFETNIPLMKSKGTVFTSDVQLNSSSFSGILTGGTIYRVANGSICCNIDVFGSDITSFENHLNFHMERVRRKGVQPILLRIFTDTHVRPVVIENLFEKFGFKRSSTYRHTNAYERDIASQF